MCIMHFDNQISVWKIHDFCHFLTNSITPGLENKNHFPWLFQAAETLYYDSLESQSLQCNDQIKMFSEVFQLLQILVSLLTGIWDWMQAFFFFFLTYRHIFKHC